MRSRVRRTDVAATNAAPQTAAPAPATPPPPSGTFGAGGLRIADFIAQTPKAKRNAHVRLGALEVAIRNAESRASSGDWEGATGPTLVGLYAMGHSRMYGAIPLELETDTEMRRASAAARKILDTHFGSDPDAAVEFVKWMWSRESKRAEWRTRVGRESLTRLSWRFFFSAAMVSDYRAEKHNESVRGRA